MTGDKAIVTDYSKGDEGYFPGTGTVTGNDYDLEVKVPFLGKNTQQLFGATTGDWTLTGLRNLTITLKNTETQGVGGNSNIFYADGGRSVTVDVANLNINVENAPIEHASDPIGFHAMGGSITAKSAQDIVFNGVNSQAVMVQASAEKDAQVKLEADGDVNLSAGVNTVTVGAIQGSNSDRKTELTIHGRNVTISSLSEARPSSADSAVQVYDQGWQSTKYFPGTIAVDIEADQNLKIDSNAAYGVYAARASKDGASSMDLQFRAGGTVTMKGSQSAMYVVSLAPTASLDIKAPQVVLTSTDPESTHATLDVRGSTTSASITADTVTITSGADGVNAVKLLNGSQLSFNGAQVNIQRGSVNAAGGKLALNNSDVSLAENSKFTAATLTGENASIVFNSMDKETVSVFDNQVKGLRVLASGALNDRYGSAQALSEALANDGVVSVAGQEGAVLGAQAGTVSNGFTVNSDGTLAEVENPALNAVSNFNAMTYVQWRNENNSLSQRLGDIRDNLGRAGAWARVYGYKSDVSDGVSLELKSNAVQVGADATVGGNWIVGAAFSYTDSEGEFSNGSGEADMYSLAAYASGMFSCGGYVDVVGRIGRISTDVTASTLSQSGGVFSSSYDNTALSLSVETGYRHQFSSMFYVEPQAELAYGYVIGDDFTSGTNGVRYDQDDFQSLVGRLGVRTGANMADGAASFYLHASVNHDFLGDADATATPAQGMARDVSVDLGGTWVSYGIGAQFTASSRLSFYGMLERSNGSDYQDDYRYSVGARYIF
ncbi:MAG: autotransporter outer membrane beta-barrel domain-containing protein [Duodenibacillus sp.]|nr:autotransporter outer membrane beta-barrel domain-containing protein [Duodenibacillus sp.]